VGLFQLLVECREQDVLLTVTDFGTGFDPALVPPIGSVRGDGRVGGFGLPLVRTLCHQAEWTPSPGGTTVRAAISLTPQVHDAPMPLMFDLSELDAYDFDELVPAPDGAAHARYGRVTN
jgi:hypothetical protein